MTLVKCCVVAIEVVLLTLIAAARQPSDLPSAPQPRPFFRSGVELVVLNVSVIDREQDFVSDLRPADFAVFDDGVRREVEFFGAAAVPLDVALLLDTSRSMEGKIPFIINAGRRLIKMLRPRDRAAVIGFSDRVQILQSFTDNLEQLDRTVQRARVGGSTSLYDALYITLKDFVRESKAYTGSRRQAIVVLSDFQDTSSLVRSDELLTAVRQANVVVYAISPVPKIAHLDDRAMNENAFALKRLAEDTGGRAFFLDTLTTLSRVYEQIAAEIGHQYTLAFVPPHAPSNRTLRQLMVRIISRPDATVRTRRSYFR